MRLRFVLMLAAMGVLSCATISPGTADRRTGPPSAGERVLNNQEAVAFSTAAIERDGYVSAEVHSVEQLRPNYWRIRFGLAPRGSGRLLEVYFDGAEQRLVKSTELEGVKGEILSTPVP